MLLPTPDHVGSPYDNIQWAAVLKSASAHDMYRKRFHRITPINVSDFLIFDAEFPRSIRHCIANAFESLHKITGSPYGFAQNSAEKTLGRLAADLNYSDITDVLNVGMHEYLDSFQVRLNEVGGEISSSFFKVLPSEESTASQQ
jgi:uncharacterized alpha-E superfamily protein